MALVHLNKPASNIITVLNMPNDLTQEQIDMECNRIPAPQWVNIHMGFDEKTPITG